jgi:hypothetical protein
VKGQVKKRKHGERLGEKLDPPIMAAAHPDSSWNNSLPEIYLIDVL